MKPTFQEMCTVLAAKNCYESGQSVAQIAASAKKSHTVVRRWLKEAGVLMRRTNV
jgi:transposase-like protein